MKKVLILIPILTVIVLTGCSKKISTDKIPEKYKNPNYCESDNDCMYNIYDGCCGQVVNSYNKNAVLWDGVSICNTPCPPEGILDFYCEQNYCKKKLNCDKACSEFKKNGLKKNRWPYKYITENCTCSQK